jgi:predicted alpha/beta superfamily hydrolase
MKKILLSIALLLFSCTGNTQEPRPLTIGFAETIPSAILKAERTIWVHLPEGYKADGAERYPVIYVLDGKDQFQALVAVIEHLSGENLAPKMIVVGILQDDRLAELTFGKDMEFPNSEGKGEQFLDYIEKELIPHVDAKYRSAPYRTFVGHSVGGLAVVHTLVHRPRLFNSYISLEGALWWDKHHVVKDAKNVLGQPSYEGTTLFIAMANHLETKPSLKQVRKDKSTDSDLIRANLELIDDFAKHKRKALRLGQQYYPNDSHSSLTLQAEYDALRFIFDTYGLKFHRSQLDNPAFDVVQRYTAHYQALTKKMGYRIQPESAGLVNNGYTFLNRKQYDRAAFFFQQLQQYYPNDPNTYDCLGDLYSARGDKPRAIESFRKGLSLGEMNETRDKLDALLSGK